MARTLSNKGSILLIKGIDVSKPAEYIDENSARESLNFEVSRGVLTKRKGGSTLGGVIAGTNLEIMNGTSFTSAGTKYNIRVGLDKIERFNTATTTWTDISGTTLTGTNTDLVSLAVPLLSGSRILCITNSIDAIRKWTAAGNTSELGGSAPKAKFIQEYKTYLVAANITGGTDISQRVQWSDTADPENWTTGNSGTVDLVEDGGDITGLNLFGDYLAIHKETSIYLGYLISSTDIFKFNRKATGVGTVANNSIVNLPTGEQLFLAKDGIRIFNGINAPLIESPINDEIRDDINASYAFKSWGIIVTEKDEAWIGIPIGSQTTGETVYKYDYHNRTLYKDTRPTACVAWLGEADASLNWDDFTVNWDEESERWNGVGFSDESERINIGQTDGYVLLVDPTKLSDDGTAISAKWVTKDFQHSQDQISRWLRLELWAKGGTVTVEYSIDEGDTWTEMSQSPFTLTDSYPGIDSPDIFYFDTVSSKIRFRFTNTASDEALAIKQFIVGYRPREIRQ